MRPIRHRINLAPRTLPLNPRRCVCDVPLPPSRACRFVGGKAKKKRCSANVHKPNSVGKRAFCKEKKLPRIEFALAAFPLPPLATRMRLRTGASLRLRALFPARRGRRARSRVIYFFLFWARMVADAQEALTVTKNEIVRKKSAQFHRPRDRRRFATANDARSREIDAFSTPGGRTSHVRHLDGEPRPCAAGTTAVAAPRWRMADAVCGRRLGVRSGDVITVVTTKLGLGMHRGKEKPPL